MNVFARQPAAGVETTLRAAVEPLLAAPFTRASEPSAAVTTDVWVQGVPPVKLNRDFTGVSIGVS